MPQPNPTPQSDTLMAASLLAATDTYNSTFITGNLREIADGVTDGFLEAGPDTRRKSFAKSRKLGIICVCFLLGAMLGAGGAHRFADHTLWLAGVAHYYLTLIFRESCNKCDLILLIYWDRVPG